MLRIERSTDLGVVFTLTGRIAADDIVELQRLIGLESVGQDITFDLREITMVDREAVKFLERCKAQNIKLENCPAYIREWIQTERGGGSQQES
jgi:hypothetical protein